MRRIMGMGFAAWTAFAALTASAEVTDAASLSAGGSAQLPLAAATPIPAGSQAAPDVLLNTATLAVTAYLKQNKNLPANSPPKIAELLESTVLPLFDFRHMTQLAVARNWRLATPDQQTALIAEFRSLLVRTYSTALVNYRDQPITYKPLRMTTGDTDVRVRSSVKQAGAEPMSIDYDMEKTASGWRVYDVKIAGISLITTYRSAFSKTIRDGGVGALIQSLSDKNRQAGVGFRSAEGDPQSVYFLYAATANSPLADR